MQIGSVIRKYRKECGLTQEEMAKRLGVTTPAVNKWEMETRIPISNCWHRLPGCCIFHSTHCCLFRKN